MKRNNTITSLFQNNQQKLNEMPSRQSWRRLERKLDDHRRYGKMTYSRQLGMVAALFVLGIVITLITILLNKSASVPSLAANYTLERLEEISDTEEASQIMAFIQKHKDQLSNPVEEGDVSRRIALAAARESAISSRISVSITDFQWLRGTWKQELNGVEALESWSKKNNYTLEGKGFVMENGTQVQVDQMNILHLGSKIYFETALQNNQKPVRYALKQFFADRIVFENKTVAFPQQVVFEIQSPNVYTIIFQNDAPLEMNNAQAKFLSQRNQMIPQRAVRTLERAE